MNFSWILCLILAGSTGLGFLLNAINKQKRKQAEEKASQTQKELDKQKDITLEYVKREIESGQIQQKATEDNAKLSAVVKGVQTSEKPVKENVSVGNDIVRGFNSSK